MNDNDGSRTAIFGSQVTESEEIAQYLKSNRVWLAYSHIFKLALPTFNSRKTFWMYGILDMGGELSKREGVLFRSFQSEARSFCCFFHRFAQIYV